MGYTTDFSGRFVFDQPLTAEQVNELKQFAALDHRGRTVGAPGYFCQWVPTDDGTAIEWDEGEKFYDYTEWLAFLIERFFKPWGRTLSGQVEWTGEDPRDQGVIHVRDNMVQAVRNVIAKPEPTW